MSTPSPRRHTIADLLRRTRRRYPERTAIRCGAVSWTYAQFDDICSRLAAGLAGLGVAPGDRVAVVSRNSHAFAALRYAVARLGAVLVPVNFMLNAEEVRYILEHAGASVLCVDTASAAVALQAADGTAVRHRVWLPAEDASEAVPGLLPFDALLADAAALVEPALEADALAQIIYTSGTESRPKGAMLTHAAVIAEYVSCLVDAEIAQGDRVLHALPLYHCAQLDVFLGPCIYVGATNVITGKPTPDNLLALMARERITSFFAPPTVWIGLLRAPQFDATDLSALAKGYYGASIMPVEVLKEILRRLPGTRLWNLYGQTEIAPVATVLPPEDQLRKAGSAGRATLNVETRVVDDAMQDVAVGQVGEIVHRSPQLLSGYYRDPERTAAAFEGGWFHSGDLGLLDEEGYLTVVDRKKDMIKTGGENVASREVEEVLYTIEGVSEVAVIGLPDPKWIEAVTAVVVRRPGSALDEAGLVAAASERLAHFKVPKRVHFVDALPKNPSGKLLKRELRRLYEAR
ncbi:acyl-CoA synthetase [Pseudorhodoferax aquiterrae]|uniref:Acyl-CoA synthetase n=1 Tax=Pseudorhodoferax aquiterrae TaxID=747304 RepID=A0ABQ3FWX8_9BURK|nr:acyl-CoA synthetase [Pseudorhodoferax aquiterrae]GHC71562.1 acyl-CoA synthetase [Pseudorhodoferax aquiterrae]